MIEGYVDIRGIEDTTELETWGGHIGAELIIEADGGTKVIEGWGGN